jgi:hypothetical protein
MILQNSTSAGSFQSLQRSHPVAEKAGQIDAVKFSDQGQFSGRLFGTTKLVVPLSHAGETCVRLGGASQDKAIVLPKLEKGDAITATLRIRELGDGRFEVKVKRAAAAGRVERANFKVDEKSGRQVFLDVAESELVSSPAGKRKLEQYNTIEQYITVKSAGKYGAPSSAGVNVPRAQQAETPSTSGQYAAPMPSQPRKINKYGDRLAAVSVLPMAIDKKGKVWMYMGVPSHCKGGKNYLSPFGGYLDKHRGELGTDEGAERGAMRELREESLGVFSRDQLASKTVKGVRVRMPVTKDSMRECSFADFQAPKGKPTRIFTPKVFCGDVLGRNDEDRFIKAFNTERKERTRLDNLTKCEKEVRALRRVSVDELLSAMEKARQDVGTANGVRVMAYGSRKSPQGEKLSIRHGVCESFLDADLLENIRQTKRELEVIYHVSK